MRIQKFDDKYIDLDKVSSIIIESSKTIFENKINDLFTVKVLLDNGVVISVFEDSNKGKCEAYINEQFLKVEKKGLFK